MTLIAYVLVLLPVLLLFYSYWGYPALLWIIARAKGADASPREHDAATEAPTVSVVVPAYNEERQIAGAIDALLAQDYPADRRQILIVSDASTDSTDAIVSSYADRGVELLRMPVRSGKTAVENAACDVIRGEIVVNSDASTRLHPTTIRRLIAGLEDPAVGVASGRDVSTAVAHRSANSVEAGYVDYEMRLRDLETRTGGIVGASGCCYAIRGDLHRLPIPADLSRDFSAPLTARQHGFRSVSVFDAIAYVPRTSSLRREYIRKVRTISRGMETLYRVRYMMDPMRYGSFAWKLISHKISRWLVPIFGVPAVVALFLLAPTHPWAAWLFGGALIVGGIAVLGALWPEGAPMPRPISMVAFGVAANVAVVHAVVRLLRQHEDKIWEPTRRDVVINP
jgi:cellulose synthase/poly-beta-1,6-N-acetylglucosamine synthase-like glycosyltransferase